MAKCSKPKPKPIRSLKQTYKVIEDLIGFYCIFVQFAYKASPAGNIELVWRAGAVRNFSHPTY